MPDPSFFQSGLFTWVILPALIFLARIVDVSIGTVRVIAIAKGMRKLAPLLGFFEVLIWLMAIGQIMQNLTNWLCYAAYGGGFAAGNYVGMWLESRLALGTVIVRVITGQDSESLAQALRAHGYGFTSVEATGNDGPARIIFMVVSRQSLPRLLDLIKQSQPNAFYSIEDVRYAQEGNAPLRRPLVANGSRPWFPGFLRQFRQGG
ncbi:MAG: DUF2179 domain-containing protein [Candidatus Zixiibacteriota bacterium]|nr:MAG: DUF2179 domain-containing protein [candidate division Zixibacteria bacterium]